MAGAKGYRSYRGRTSKGKIALAVVLVLLLGTIVAGVIGFATGSLTLATYSAGITDGISGMASIIIVTIILMAIMGFMAAQLIATTLRGSAESAGQIKNLTEATSTLEECIAYLNTEAMQQKAASDLIKDKGLEALLEAQDKRELWHPDGCPSCPDNLLITVKRGSVELSRAF